MPSAGVELEDESADVATCLPVELWHLIFAECVPEPGEPNLVHAPLNVSQVCRRWRTIALSNPVLWTALTLTTTGRRYTDLLALDRLLELWLHRSGARLLSVSLTQAEAVKSTSPIILVLLDAVFMHAPRLRRLDVRAPETCLLPLELPELSFPALEYLKIQSLSASDSGPPLDRVPWLRLTRPFIAFLSTAPRLQILHLACLPLYETQVVEILQRIPSLDTFVLEGAYGAGEWRTRRFSPRAVPTPARVPRLRDAVQRAGVDRLGRVARTASHDHLRRLGAGCLLGYDWARADAEVFARAAAERGEGD
ncbi:hypothetical protein C8R44DRAFT_245108 [Mycena epipterygia]|nr:hypothetical protein C8R44DRAFT_245108 [Mycena epipterygia]